MQLVVKYNEYG